MMLYHLNNTDEKLQEISARLSLYSFNNIEWSCLYSGFGILNELSKKDLKKLLSEKHIDKEANLLMENLTFLKCIYKKAKPVFSNPPEEILNPGQYMWDFNTFNKLILPSSQAMAILSLCAASEIIYQYDSLKGTIMIKNAETYYEFLTTYLRSDDGLFVSAEDKTKYLNDKLKIKQLKGSSKISDQVLIFEALLNLYRLTKKGGIKEYHSSKSENYLKEANNIFDFLSSNYEELQQLNSSELSICISSLTRCCNILPESNLYMHYKNLIAMLCAEVESRIKITGELESSYNDTSPASLITHFNIITSLVNGYFETGIDKFGELALKVYSYTEDLYDKSLNLFIQQEEPKLSYSIKDICEVILGLLSIYKMYQSDSVYSKLIEFYHETIEKTQIVQSIPEKICSINSLKNIELNNVPLMKDIQKAPVFLKGIRFNLKKIAVCTVSNSYHSYYALYSSFLFLYDFYPIINIEQEKETSEKIIDSFNDEANNIISETEPKDLPPNEEIKNDSPSIEYIYESH